ncbi:MAG: HEPN domain-containing protein [Candidatus Omnitrophica bacterium]|nr:HEPN domain-containing protein [Candidatus Omnitrophota bacterium]
MGKRIGGSRFRECLDKGKLRKFSAAKGLVFKELKSSKADLKAAVESCDNKNYKWSTIQAYYSMFHAGRALIYSKGYRERSHYCLIVALKELFIAEGLLKETLVEALQTAKTLRENADYENEFSKVSAQALLHKARELLKQAEIILK